MATETFHSSRYHLYRTNKRVTVVWNNVEYIDQFEVKDDAGNLKVVGTEIHFVSGKSVQVEDVFSYVERDMLSGK